MNLEANTTRKKHGKIFLGEIREQIEYYIILHFWYIYNILQAEVFCDH